MWRWQNLVVVLAQPDGSGLPVLTGLDASTGQPRWRLPIGGSVHGSAPTADGGLAMAVWSNLGDGVLEVVDLSSGHVRWTAPVGSDADPPVAVADDAVLYAANSQLTSYDDGTGQVRWTEALSALPDGADDVVWQASAGLVYLTGSVSQADGQAVQVLVGISAANGRVRWRVVSPYPAIATPAGIVTAPGPDQITMRGRLSGQARWTAGLPDGWLPLGAPPGQTYQPSPALPVFPAGPLLVVPAAGPDGSDQLAAFGMSDGYSYWQVTIPGPLAAPLSAAPGGILVYAV